MIIDWSTVPGYSEAITAERSGRDGAFLSGTTELCGIEVYQLTLWHMAALDCCGNPFLAGGTVMPWHVVQFLWCLSVEYREAKDKSLTEAFAARCRPLDFEQSVTAIRTFVDDANADSPGSSGQDSQPFCSWIATVVHVIASNYGWSEDSILSTPVVRLWQYLRCVRRANDDRAVFVNRSDKIKSRHLRDLSEQSHGA